MSFVAASAATESKLPFKIAVIGAGFSFLCLVTGLNLGVRLTAPVAPVPVSVPAPAPERKPLPKPGATEQRSTRVVCPNCRADFRVMLDNIGSLPVGDYR